MKKFALTIAIAFGSVGAALAQEPVWDANKVVLESQKIADGIFAVIATGADEMADKGLPIAISAGFGIATQKPELRKLLHVQPAAEKLARYFGASTELMQVLARACGHASLSGFTHNDITTWKREMADLSGVRFAGIGQGS